MAIFDAHLTWVVSTHGLNTHPTLANIYQYCDNLMDFHH